MGYGLHCPSVSKGGRPDLKKFKACLSTDSHVLSLTNTCEDWSTILQHKVPKAGPGSGQGSGRAGDGWGRACSYIKREKE